MEIAENLINDWILYHDSLDKKIQDKCFYAVDYVLELALDNEHEKLWCFIYQTYSLELSDKVLASLGAGPLENLLSSHSQFYIDKVEALARKDAKFKKLLAIVWQGNIPQNIWNRIGKVKGESW